jgi:hypothetical protein
VDKDRWFCSYMAGRHTQPVTEYADTEADARAKMLIYLIENGFIKPGSILVNIELDQLA